MLSDKEQKKVFKKVASKNPEKFYPVEIMKEKGFIRKKCNCGTYFWTTVKEREHCGDPVCSGGFDVVDNNPSKNHLSYIGVWEKLVEILEPRGYKPIKRYPVVARWNPTVEFTIASIAAFQPYVITGEAEPPAKKLIIPQMCLRFNDIENVGITGSHLCGFSMIGQHVFVSPEEWNQSEYFRDIMDFLVDGVGLETSEFVIHEDAWSGGGSFGPCLEFFSRGVELFNQVYTMFEQTPDGDRELQLKVLDMGMGQERIAWFSQGVPNIYEATFPHVLNKLREKTNVIADLHLFNRFSKYSAYLNIDEVEDIDEAWKKVAESLALPVKTLKAKILPMTGLYSIAEHSRALLFAITDGKLPSNTGGGYNLRVIFRRAVAFADRFNWDVKIQDVCRWHAEELFDIFPEISERLDEVEEVLKVEYKKYQATKKKAIHIVRNLLEKDSKITEAVLIQLYDSNGIDPDMVVSAARKLGKKIKKPDNFYQKVVELHEQKEQVAQT
ncbi:MAG: alanine--tRNA ligase-related protein, partial [Promethearchaeota archaeon]